MKKITVQRAHDLLVIMANGGNPEEASVEEIMLACKMGATAISGLGIVTKHTVEAAEAAMHYATEVKRIEGEESVSRIHLDDFDHEQKRNGS